MSASNMRKRLVKPVLKYHGAKFGLAQWIINHFPTHDTYVEPFGGSGAVLLIKKPSKLEIYNDLNKNVTVVFEVLRDRKLAKELQMLLELTPYSRVEYDNSILIGKEPPKSIVEHARRTIVRSWLSYGAKGITSDYHFRIDRSFVKMWSDYPKRIMNLTHRLKDVAIENMDVLYVLGKYDSKETLFYLDPPYILSTRVSVGEYANEMSDDDHFELLYFLRDLKGYVVLSGYESDIYNEILSDWKIIYKKTTVNSNIKSTKIDQRERKECLWLNPRCVERISYRNLFW